MLNSIKPTVLEPDLRKVASAMETVPGLMEAMAKNEVFTVALKKLAEAESNELNVNDLYKTAFATTNPDVLQMGYSEAHNGYWIKKANRKYYYNEDPEILPRGKFIKWAGEELTHKVDTDGVVTIAETDSDADGAPVDSSTWSVVDEPGIYKVKTIHGKELTGWVIPNLMALDGTVVPMSVFTNGSQAMIQSEILGSKVGIGVDLPAAPAKGTGVFYCSGPGGVVATVPLAVMGAEAEMDGGDSYIAHSLTGESTKVRLVPGLKKLKVLGNEFLMPDTAKFLPLDEEGVVPLVSSPDEVPKTAAAMLDKKITLFGWDGDRYGLRFENLPKLASASSGRQDQHTAAFTLCLAGCEPQEAYQKLAEASAGNTVTVGGLSDVTLAADLAAEAQKEAASNSEAILALRQDLLKEASVLPDVLTVDSVLSLGFINSENVRLFASRIPYLEKALSMICELLLASRLGLTEIPEFATARCMRGMDDTIQGLKALALREIQEGTRRSA